jgi:hypothetical protein
VPYQPEEAAQRIASATKPETIIRRLMPVVGLVGWVKGRRFQLTTRLPFMNNSFDIALPLTLSALLAPQSWHPNAPPRFFRLIFPWFGVLLLVIGRLLGSSPERRLLAQLDGVLGVYQEQWGSPAA